MLALWVGATGTAFGEARAVRATRRTGPVSIDGRVTEDAWRSAPTTDGFWQRSPNEGATPLVQTSFQVLYDDAALYIAVRALDSEPDQIRGLLTRRDEDSASDWILVGIDSYHDKRTAFMFGLNPAGVQRDSMLFDDTNEDASWDAVWDGHARVADDGWVAEFRIPLSQLRFADAGAQTWGLQVMRVVARTKEESVWSPLPRDAAQIVSLFGTVDGIDGVEQTRRVELLPYALGGAQLADALDGDPFTGDLSGAGSIGLDAKYGLGSNVTVAATINPDFGQVEADPSEVNLSAQETFFEEKRPFFLDGADIFRFGLGQGDGPDSVEQLFYSRRIGSTPHDSADGLADYVQEPDSTTIYGAAKISGKTASGWSFGVLDAVTAQEKAQLAMVDGTTDDLVVEPLTNYAVLRLRRDLNDGRTTFGAAMTAVNRSLDGTGMGWLHDQAYTGGLQINHRFASDRWNADARMVGSYVHGSPEAIDITQRESQHYFQRPDADHIDYDPTRTSLVGAGLLWSVVKVAGGSWRYGTGSDARTPGLEANDIGFQRSADYCVQWLWGQYRHDQPGDTLLSWMVNTEMWGVTNFAPTLLGHGGNVSGEASLKNYWGARGGVGIERNLWDTSALRGGPAVRADEALNMWGGVWSDPRHTVRGNLDVFAHVAPAADSWSAAVNPALTIQARSNVAIALGPMLAWNHDDRQFVTETFDAAGDAHYILARIRQTTAGMTVRVNYTYSPRLSVQMYAQPFISVGHYSDYKEASDPRAESYADRYHTFVQGEFYGLADGSVAVDSDRNGVVDFGFERADFNFRQLNSNVVVRWEYRPGSTVFFIWSHGRTSETSLGRFALGDDLTELFEERGEHVVLVKANYWFGL